MMNVFCIAGKLAGEPVIKETPGGIRMALLTVEVERPFANSMGIYEKDRIEVEVWRGLAETLASTCKQGDWVTAKGRIAARPYEKDGNTWYNYSFVAERVDVLK
ncbi:single-stranded DNA-binding protein [Faecalibaculum rodentium]|uniref:single-stranded DNA-binding protein n=1 Tax=Faecalibaculum rodentium TaxID=1702221 RepID=UPI00272AEAC9|nr:single-stranded DNA-binding protein [Faecalibaculum rodentium]